MKFETYSTQAKGESWIKADTLYSKSPLDG